MTCYPRLYTQYLNVRNATSGRKDQCSELLLGPNSLGPRQGPQWYISIYLTAPLGNLLAPAFDKAEKVQYSLGSFVTLGMPVIVEF